MHIGCKRQSKVSIYTGKGKNKLDKKGSLCSSHQWWWNYRLLKVSDDSFLIIAIMSLNNNELQAAFDNCFAEIMSRHETASESAPVGHMNLSSRSLAIQVSATLKMATWTNLSSLQKVRYSIKRMIIDTEQLKDKLHWLKYTPFSLNSLEMMWHPMKRQATCSIVSNMIVTLIKNKSLHSTRRESKLTQTITVNDSQAMTSFLIQLPEINNKRVTISNFQQKRLSGHAHTQLTSTIWDQLVNMWSWAACSSRFLLYLQAHFSIWWNDSFSSPFSDSLNCVCSSCDIWISKGATCRTQ